MARPQKVGLEYYPQDTDIHSDRKIRRLITEFGTAGYLVYDYIKCLCYKENGYWVRFDADFCFDVADVLKSGITENSVQEVLNGCLKIGLFSKRVFTSYQIITSSGIQKRFIKIKKTGVIDELIGVIDEETPLIYTITPENDPISTQSKVKESKEKEKESKKKESKGSATDVAGSDSSSLKKPVSTDSEKETTPHWKTLIEVWFNFYESHFKIKPTFTGPAPKALKAILDKLAGLSKEFGKDWTEEYAINTLKHFLTKAIADGWRKENFMLHILNSHFDAIIQKNEHATTKGNRSDLSDLKRELARKAGGVTSEGR